MTVLRQGLNAFLSSPFSLCEDKSWLEWHELRLGLWWLQREARDVRGGDWETEVDGCFTGNEGGGRKKWSAHVCQGEIDKEREFVWYREFTRNIKDLKLNKREHESGRLEKGIEIGEGKEQEGTWDEKVLGLKKCFHKSRHSERETEKSNLCFPEKIRCSFKLAEHTAENGGNAHFEEKLTTFLISVDFCRLSACKYDFSFGNQLRLLWNIQCLFWRMASHQ